MKLTVQQIAEIVTGKVQGEAGRMIEGISPLSEATSQDLSFINDSKHLKEASSSNAGALLVNQGTEIPDRTLIWVDHPQTALLKILQVWEKENQTGLSGIHPTAILSPEAKIGSNVSIGPYCVVETNARIGDNSSIGAFSYIGHGSSVGRNCRIYPQVTIREQVAIGNQVIIHSGSVIGADGFGYLTLEKKHHKIPQIGTVEIGDDVEIGANVTIDRATLGKTRVGKGTKIDNLVQIAHNVQIGEGCIIVAQVGIAGSSNLGNFVTLAGQVGVRDHVKIGDGSIAAAQSGISSNVMAGSVVFGSPARPIQQERKIQAILNRLPKIYEEFRKIKKLVISTEKNNS